MNPSPEEKELGPENVVMVSTIVVVNIIWWMVMIAGIGLGATHLHRCPVQPNIPIFLIVLGAASLLSLSLTYTRTSRREGTVSILSLPLAGLIYLFTFCWFIAGTTWVYSVYPPSYTPGEAQYCHKTTFLFAFALIAITWGLLTLIFVLGCCFAALTCCKTVRARRHLIPTRNSTFYGSISDPEGTTGDV